MRSIAPVPDCSRWQWISDDNRKKRRWGKIWTDAGRGGPMIGMTLRSAFLLALSAIAGAGTATADDFPNRPIILVVPFAGGSGADITARTVGNGLSEVLKQPVVVENHDGASGAIGLSYTARAKPDGYTIVMGGIGGVVLHPAVEGDKMSFNPQKELAPVALVAKASPVLIVNASLGVKTLPELIALAKSSR
jgi:tripartite-type tricarboxylate transporter receptor subunit TctC